jgi:hypothetical protein
MADDQGTSVEERAENGEHEEPMEELFPRGVVEHDGKGIDVIFRRHRANVETTVALSRAEVPLRGGLLEVDSPVMLLVRGEVSHYVPRPTRGSDGKQEGWKVQTVLRAGYVEAFASNAAAAESSFRRVVEDTPKEAQGLLDRLRSIAEEHAIVS